MTEEIIIQEWNSTVNRTLKFAYGLIESALETTEPLEYKVSKIEMALNIIIKIRTKELKEKELFPGKVEAE